MNKCLIKVALIFLLLIASFACKSRVPAGFWLKFTPNSIILHDSKQGLYGGRSFTCWQTSGNDIFNISDFKNFAKNHGWKLQDSFKIKSSWLAKFNFFPFTYSRFSDSNLVDVGFRSWVLSDAILYRFNTGWIAVEPGNAKETDQNGYVVISSNGSRVAVYHKWGE